MKIRATGTYEAQWGEGALWIDDALYYVDIEGRALLRQTGEKTEVLAHTPFMPSAIVGRREGGFLCAGEGGLYTWDGKGAPAFLTNPENRRPDQRMNDGKCSPDGRFFVGSINPQRLPEAGLFCLDHDLTVRRVLSGVCNSNGIVWTGDGSEVFYIDTPTRQVARFDYRDGALTNRRAAFSTAAWEASPDGMCIARDGSLWIAMCHAGCVLAFSPDGKLLEKLDFPCREVSSCCFGGAGGELLYVTTGKTSSRREKEAGRLFVVEGLGVSGIAPYKFLF